jgi:hypothetical protein
MRVSSLSPITPPTGWAKDHRSACCDFFECSGAARPPGKILKNIQIHSSLDDFLTVVDAGGATVDEMSIREEITTAILDQAREIAVQSEWGRPNATFQLGKAHRPKISGYATPKPSLVAISFEASFDLEADIVEHETETREEGTMTLKGVCSYDPTTKKLLDIEIKEWSKKLGNWVRLSADKTALERQYGPERMRFLD